MRIRGELTDEFFEEGFSERTDLFGHKDLADRLTHLFSNLEHGTVSILQGRWGTGKTVFARLWDREMEKNGIPAIYFDAFASDYIEDPFQAVSAAFIKAAALAKKTKSTTYARFVTRAAKASKTIAGTAAKVGAKIITLGIVGASEIDQLAALKAELSSSAGELSEDAVKQLLEAHATSENTFAELRRSISELPALLTPAAPITDASPTKPSLVILIDELDRCRPDFALGVLETLKHFFRVDRVHFVLITTSSIWPFPLVGGTVWEMGRRNIYNGRSPVFPRS